MSNVWYSYCEIYLIWILLDFRYVKSALFHVTAWCTKPRVVRYSILQSLFTQRYRPSYRVTRPQRVKIVVWKFGFSTYIYSKYINMAIDPRIKDHACQLWRIVYCCMALYFCGYFVINVAYHIVAWRLCLSRSLSLAISVFLSSSFYISLQWRHNGRDGVSNYQPHDCLLNHLFRRRSKKISKLRVTGLCAGNSPVTGEFPATRASNAENVSIW